MPSMKSNKIKLKLNEKGHLACAKVKEGAKP